MGIIGRFRRIKDWVFFQLWFEYSYGIHSQTIVTHFKGKYGILTSAATSTAWGTTTAATIAELLTTMEPIRI